MTFAQFVMLTPFPGTVDFAAWEKTMESDTTRIGGVPLTRHWLIPQALRPKVYTPHPVMEADEIRRRTQAVWDDFYSLPKVWERSSCVEVAEVAARVRAHLEAVPADVREHRDCDRQRAREPFGALGADDCGAVPPAVLGAADARFAGAGLENPKSRGGLCAAPSSLPAGPARRPPPSALGLH